MPRKWGKPIKKLYYHLLNVGSLIKSRTAFCRRTNIPDTAVSSVMSGKGNMVSLHWIDRRNRWMQILSKMCGRILCTSFVEKTRTLTLKQLTREIPRIWRSLPLEYAVNLVENMLRRCQAIIDGSGDWTHY